MDNKRRGKLSGFLAIVLFLCGYIIYSAIGILPKSLSVSLPSFMQNYSSNLTILGYSIQDRADYEKTHNCIAKQTFDNLFLSNANVFNNGYYDPKTHIAYFNHYSVNEPYLSRYDVKKGKLKKTIVSDSLGKSALIPVKGFYVGANRIDEGETGMCILYARKAAGFMEDTTENFYNEDNSLNISAVCELLRREKKEKINLEEFSGLMELYYKRVLVRWFPATDTVVLRTAEGEGDSSCIRKVNIQTEESEVIKTLPEDTCAYMLNENTLLYYHNEDLEIKVESADQKEPATYTLEAKSGIMCCNYFETEDKRTYIAYITADKTMFLFDHTNRNPLYSVNMNSKISNSSLRGIVLTEKGVIYYDEMNRSEYAWDKQVG